LARITKKPNDWWELVKALKVHIATIHDDIATGLRIDLVQHVNVTHFAVSDIDKNRNRTLQIDHGVKFHGTLGATKLGPGEQGQTQINGGGIQRINGRVEIQSQIGFSIQWPSHLNEALGEVGIDSPIPTLIGIGKRGTLTGERNPE
jgi:hypothetical protein